jgi:hypothetical protein
MAVASWLRLTQIVRAPLTLLTLAALGLLVPEQTRDMLDFLNGGGEIAFHVSLLCLAFSAWYWARASITAQLDNRPLHESSVTRGNATIDGVAASRSALEWYPRLLYLGGIGLGIAMVLESTNRGRWLVLAAMLVVYAAAFAVIVFRLPLLHWLKRSPAIPSLAVRHGPWPGLLQCAPFDRRLALGMLLLAALAFVLGGLAGFVPACRDPIWHTLAYTFSGPSIVLFGLGLMIAPFAMLTFAADHIPLPGGSSFRQAGFRPPVMVAALAVLGGMTWCLPLHTLRAAPDAGLPPNNRKGLNDVMEAWRKGCGDVRPILVAISGGASRAGVAGAAVLYRLDQIAASRDSHARIFAVSSVSGGSLGAAAYFSLLGGRNQASATSCAGLGQWPEQDAKRVLAQQLGRDALAPLLTGLLFGDIPRATLGLALPLGQGGDRAEAIERGFDHLWQEAIQQSQGLPSGMMPVGFDSSYLRLFYDRNGSWKTGMPVWLANGTDSQTGARLLTVPFQMPAEARRALGAARLDPGATPPWPAAAVNVTRKAWPFTGAYDLLALAQQDVTISTAINNTARFPYLEPSGEVAGRTAQVVDGGYFENQGLSTARDLEVLFTNAIVVQVTADSDPDVKRTEDVIRCTSPLPGPDEPGKRERSLQLLAPVLALYNVRGGHSQVALRDARAGLCERGRFFHFYLPARRSGGGTSIPMNWVVSRTTAEIIWDAMLANPAQDPEQAVIDVGNGAEWEALRAAITSATND